MADVPSGRVEEMRLWWVDIDDTDRRVFGAFVVGLHLATDVSRGRPGI